MEAAYALMGAVFAALFFFAGWKFRDSLGVARGEPPVVVTSPPKNVVLEDWDLPEEAE